MENGYNCSMPMPDNSSNAALSAPTSNQSYPMPVKVESEVSGMQPSNMYNLLPQREYSQYDYANNMAQYQNFCNMAQNAQMNMSMQNAHNTSQNFQMQQTSPAAAPSFQMNLPSAQNSPHTGQINMPNAPNTVQNGQMNAQTVENPPQNAQTLTQLGANIGQTPQMNTSDHCTTSSEYSDGSSNDSGVSSDESRPLSGNALQQANAMTQANAMQQPTQYQDFKQDFSNFYPLSMEWLSNPALFNKSTWGMPYMPQMQIPMPNMSTPVASLPQPPATPLKDSKLKNECVSTSDLTGILEDIKADDLKNRIKVELKEKALWEQFKDLEMEMIITKTGRNLFPKLVFTVSGLEPANRYLFYIRFHRVGDQKFKYVKAEWVEGGKAEEEHSVSPCPHPENLHFPMGAAWMQSEIGFPKLKLTNNCEEKNHTHAVVLRSMHKYTPVLAIHRFDPTAKTFSLFVEKQIDMASFIAVTAYQNAAVTNLKISANPFAKGFREGGRKRSSIDDSPIPSKSSSMTSYNGGYSGFGYFGNLGLSMPGMGMHGMGMPGMGMPNFANMSMNSYFNMPSYLNGLSSMFNPAQQQQQQ